MLGEIVKAGREVMFTEISQGINVRPNPGPGFSNPWEMNSWAQAGVRRTEDELTSGILGTSTRPTNPSILRHLLFQFMTLIGYGYMYEDEIVQRTKANKEAEERTHNL